MWTNLLAQLFQFLFSQDVLQSLARLGNAMILLLACQCV
jgi:hypothetical protein